MKTDIGRLALRKEGEFWNAYWSPHLNNMDQSVLIGSIRMTTVKGKIHEDFIELMKNAFEIISQDIVRESITWGVPKPAPEDERGGNA
jgi:cellulase/cellobiase CelA1